MRRVVRSQAARSDLVEHYVHLAEEAGEAIAERFFERVGESLSLIAGQPLIGAAVPSQRSELHGIRKWVVSDFDRFLIFYRPRQDDVLVVRVLHSSQDWWNLLGLTS